MGSVGILVWGPVSLEETYFLIAPNKIKQEEQK